MDYEALDEDFNPRNHVNPAQDHLSDVVDHSDDFEQAALDRNMSHAKYKPSEVPDVYINGKDVDNPTITVDPVGNAQWNVHDGVAHKFWKTTYRGRALNHQKVERLDHMLDIHPPHAETFVPTSYHLDRSLKYSGRCAHNSTRGYSLPGDGQLPSLSRMVWEGYLITKPDWVIEREQWAPGRDRAFDCGGWCR